MNDWSIEETDEALVADHRNFYEVEKWSKDGQRVRRFPQSTGRSRGAAEGQSDQGLGESRFQPLGIRPNLVIFQQSDLVLVISRRQEFVGLRKSSTGNSTLKTAAQLLRRCLNLEIHVDLHADE